MAMMKKILVIEDEPQTRDIFLECLRQKDSTPFAENGREGVQRAQQLPDLVICDVMMPEMDGGVLTTLRQDP